MFDNQTAALIRKINTLEANQAKLQAALAEVIRRPRSITEEIDAIPGRRTMYTLSAELSFTAANDGQRVGPLNMQVSQDGPFVGTHFPMFSWWPNLPTNADNYGRISPIGSYPLPAQEVANQDIIDANYEVVDAGNSRNFQNLTVNVNMSSRPGDIVPLPVPTLLAPNSLTAVFVTFLNIFFDTAPAVDTTGGLLHIDWPGYRIVNL